MAQNFYILANVNSAVGTFEQRWCLELGLKNYFPPN